MPSSIQSLKTITRDQESQLLNACPKLKHQVILILLLYTGLRPNELIQLQWQHIHFANNQIEIIKKTNSRTIPLTQRLLQLLSKYYQSQTNATTEDYLFPSNQENKPHIGRKQIWKIINQKSKGTINPTMLRNTFAARLLATKDIASAKALLGNKTLEATERHLIIPNQKKESAWMCLYISNQ